MRSVWRGRGRDRLSGRVVVASLVCLTMAGCASPEVEYARITGPDLSGAQKFAFSASVLTFTHLLDKNGQATDEVAITSVPVEAGPEVYSIAGVGRLRNWDVTTDLDVTHRGDTKLVQSIGVTVTDNLPNDIAEVGSIAAAAAAFAAGVSLPDGLDVTSAILEAKDGRCAMPSGEAGPITCTDLPLKGGGADYRADIAIAAVQVDAFPFASARFPRFTSGNFIYSACRRAIVTLKAGSNPLTTVPVVIADPNYLEAIRLPTKGKITAGASCGADSTSSDAALPTALTYANALLTAAQKVKAALPKTVAPASK